MIQRLADHRFVTRAPVWDPGDIDPFYEPADRAATREPTPARESGDPLAAPEDFPDTLIAR